jgi:hypothetical protein
MAAPIRSDPLGSIDPDAILHAVVRYLLAKGLTEAAHHLATASINIQIVRYTNAAPGANLILEGAAPFFDYFGRLLDASGFPFSEAMAADADTFTTMRTAFQHALPGGVDLERFERRLLVPEVAEGWRQDILRELDGQGGHNQGVAFAAAEVLMWRGLRFRSLSEVKIAEVLEAAGVMFFPNSRARLGVQKRGNLEPDFLVCHKGTWGILEVDGEPFHPPTRTVHDHERDRPFIRHDIKLVQHYDATRCRNNPDAVVTEFLMLLEKVRE